MTDCVVCNAQLDPEQKKTVLDIQQELADDKKRAASGAVDGDEEGDSEDDNESSDGEAEQEAEEPQGQQKWRRMGNSELATSIDELRCVECRCDRLFVKIYVG